MSRVAKKPIPMPKGVECNITAEAVTVKGPKGSLSFARPRGVDVKMEDGQMLFDAGVNDMAMAGTVRAVLSNMVTGVSLGYRLDFVLNLLL